MKQPLLLCGLAVVGWFAAGCQQDFYANQIITADTSPGRLTLQLSGSAETLLKQGKIDLHREIVRPDGAMIDVWGILGEPKEPGQGIIGTMILLHGLGESKASMPIPGLARRLSKRGYDVVLPDLRAHGRSTGEYITYGANEKHDIKAVVDHLTKEGLIHTPTYAFGVNLGGTVAIQYAAIDDRCQGVMAVEPFKDIASVGWSKVKLMDLTMDVERYDEILARAGEMGGFDPSDASAVEAARELHCPLLLVHGMFNLGAPREHTQAIYDAAAGPKKLISPTVESVVLAMVLENWLADQLDKLAREGIEMPESP